MSKAHITERVEILDSSITYSVREVCERCGVQTEFVTELVAHGVITPLETKVEKDWRFDTRALTRLRRAHRLQQDLNINTPGLALSLELLDDLKQLRQQVDALHQQLQQLSDGL